MSVAAGSTTASYTSLTYTGLSQPRFAQLLGVSVRTLQEWEQGRRAPSGAARTLLLIAAKNPRALIEVA
jgi:putative transcriptional regulator